MRLWRGSCVTCVALIALISTPCSAGVRVPGGAAGGNPIKSCGGQFLFDTGADQTFLSRACATEMGLLNAAGAPVGNNGVRNFNGGAIKTWCFDGVAIAGISSAGQNCVSTETVYVAQVAGNAANDNILGEPWQQHVNACYRAVGKATSWPWTPPAGATKVGRVGKINTSTNELKCVIEGVTIDNGSSTAALDMVFMSGSPYSFLPASVATLLGGPAGSVDLASTDPETYAMLQTASMNPSLQSVFGTMAVDGFDMGFGTVNAPLTLLVSNDSNSNFGVMGDDLVQCPDGIILFSASDGPCGAFLCDKAAVPEPGVACASADGVAGSVCDAKTPQNSLTRVRVLSAVLHDFRRTSGGVSGPVSVKPCVGSPCQTARRPGLCLAIRLAHRNYSASHSVIPIPPLEQLHAGA